MSVGTDIGPDDAALRRLYEAKATGEIRLADAMAPGSDVVASRGALIAQVAVVKGLRGPAESAGGDALSGPDGTGVVKALVSLGYDPASIFFSLSRPEADLDVDRLSVRLRALLEAVDPELVVAMDETAASDVARAFRFAVPRPGKVVAACGRRFVALSGFEESLTEETSKRRVWRELQATSGRPSVY